ncbi:hypothetical protein [Shimia aestuarii]|uniref:hypothetical protein n=1 Tax=Shimia aestuarii TaxID=254406 RepID=UPI001FB3B168|nr:hypothetical protein [Shimia aestuarii]
MERMKAIFVVTAALAFLLSPLSTSGFNGFTADQFPIPQTDPPVQPAGYAFSIWGVIYLWLMAGALFGLFKRDRARDWTTMRWPLILSLVVGAAWIPAANMDPVAATAMIWIMLGAGLAALARAGRSDHFWLRAPIGLYTGWLTAASCVATGLVLAGHGLLSEQIAALAMIALALLLALWVQTRVADTPEYGLAVIWATVGILVDNVSPLNGAVVALCGLGLPLLAWPVLRALDNLRR